MEIVVGLPAYEHDRGDNPIDVSLERQPCRWQAGWWRPVAEPGDRGAPDGK